MIFKEGDRVFHRNLKRYGTYVEDDWASDDSCYVKFDNEDNPDDVLCVTKKLIERKLIYTFLYLFLYLFFIISRF